MEKMKELMAEIKEVTKKQKSANKINEIQVMKAMLNDPDFTVSVYDKNKGFIGTKNPHEEAVKFAANICTSITGIDSKSADELASNYEFTKKDAIFMVDTAKTFVQTYMETGRKLPIIQSETSQAELLVKHVEAKEKNIPGKSETTKVAAYDKVVCRSKCPKYNR